jgi:hypothetical protein
LLDSFAFWVDVQGDFRQLSCRPDHHATVSIRGTRRISPGARQSRCKRFMSTDWAFARASIGATSLAGSSFLSRLPTARSSMGDEIAMDRSRQFKGKLRRLVVRDG